jgi:ABC-2 type transport system permease protein
LTTLSIIDAVEGKAGTVRRSSPPVHALRAAGAIIWRDLRRFATDYRAIIAALVRPAVWLILAAGMQTAFGQLMFEPASTFGSLAEYMVPGLVGLVLLHNAIQSALALVYDRSGAGLRAVLGAPLPRWYVLGCKVVAAAIIGVVQAYGFLVLATVLDVYVPWHGGLAMLPAILLAALALGAIALFLAVYIRALRNLAGTIVFVIIPVFLLSSALYPLWRFRGNGADILYVFAEANPFTHAVELVRFAGYSEVDLVGLAVTVGVGIVAFVAAVVGYNPERSLAASEAELGA